MTIDPIKCFTTMIVLLVMFAGCKSEFLVETYVSDAYLDENVDTPAVMRVEIPSCSSRSEHEDKILSLFESGSNAKITGCEEEGLNSFIAVSLDAEIASKNSKRDLIIFRDILNDLEIEGQTYEVRALKPVISEGFLQRVNTLMQESMQTLSYDDIKFEIALNNDERREVFVTSYNLWVDGMPFEAYRRQPLKRRGKITLTFSNLTSDLILRKKMPVVAYIGRLK